MGPRTNIPKDYTLIWENPFFEEVLKTKKVKRSSIDSLRNSAEEYVGEEVCVFGRKHNLEYSVVKGVFNGIRELGDMPYFFIGGAEVHPGTIKYFAVKT